MPIPVVCSACGSRLKAPDETAGKQVGCPGCSAAVPVPAARQPAAVAGQAPSRRPAAPPSVQYDDLDVVSPGRSPDKRKADAPRSRPRADREEEDDRSPPDRRARPKRKSSAMLWVLLGVGGGGALLLLLVCAGVGYFVFFQGGRVNEANFDRIQVGQSEAEVVALLGKPNETVDIGDLGALLGRQGGRNLKVNAWKEGERGIVVWFADGKVTNKHYDANGGVTIQGGGGAPGGGGNIGGIPFGGGRESDWQRRQRERDQERWDRERRERDRKTTRRR